MTDIAGELRQAETCLQQGQLATSEKIVNSVLHKSPENVEALNILGSLLATRGNVDKAIRVFSQASRLSPDDTQLHFNLGRCYQLQKDFLRAKQSFQSAVNVGPDNVAAWSVLAHLHETSDEQDACVDACEQVLRLATPDDGGRLLRFDALLGIGTAELKRRNYSRAIEALNAALDENAMDARAHSKLGAAYMQQDRGADAIESFLKAADLRPESPVHLMNAAIVHLREGNLGMSHDLIQQSLSIDPGNRRVLSAYGPLLWEMGQDDRYRALFDYDNMISSIDLVDPPQGYGSLASFHQSLIQEIRDHPTLSGGRESKSTTGGLQTGNMFVKPTPATRALYGLVNAQINEYISSERHCPGSPGTEWVKEWNLIGWGVILSSQGYQSAHNHPSGMVSGVYYVKIPQEVHDDGQFPGCIEFGPPNDQYGTRREPPRHRFLAQEGRMYLFPSHYWHRTIPFESNQERISIAFDAIPRQKPTA